MNQRILVTVQFTVNKEPVPGVFHDPQDFAERVADDVMYRLQSYKPEIITKTATFQQEQEGDR